MSTPMTTDQETSMSNLTRQALIELEGNVITTTTDYHSKKLNNQ